GFEDLHTGGHGLDLTFLLGGQFQSLSEGLRFVVRVVCAGLAYGGLYFLCDLILVSYCRCEVSPYDKAAQYGFIDQLHFTVTGDASAVGKTHRLALTCGNVTLHCVLGFVVAQRVSYIFGNEPGLSIDFHSAKFPELAVLELDEI